MNSISTHWRRSAAFVLLSGIFTTACLEGGEAELVATSTEPEALYYLSTATWGQRDIPVCWTVSGYATEKAWVREALRGQRSWARFANINFTGWGSCGGSTTGIHIGEGDAATYLQSGGLSTMNLDFTSPETAYYRCTENSLTREECIKTVALHEFGHALGFAHEQNRPDTPASCTEPTQGPNGDTTYGSWDSTSIMNYCNYPDHLSGLDRRGAERVYGPRSGDSPNLGDFNADGRDDLFCHQVISGSLYLDLANSSGQFGGSDWSAASSWCNSSDTRRIFTGDFNGDNREDLLCFDVASGPQGIDYANSSGQFGGTDYTWASTWCGVADTQQLFIGDFNGDSRDDLLCFSRPNGVLSIDYADSSGHFAGTDSFTTGWCNSTTTRRLFVGDFNGDGKDDVYCHDFVGGSQYIDYANSSGQFSGTEWSVVGSGWCDASAASLLIGDYNGDGKDDLLCHNMISGERGVDLASAAGQFGGTNHLASNAWCVGSGALVFTGDVNGDGRDDLVCHAADGRKWIDYASSTGAFASTDWSTSSTWCGGEAGELY